MFNLLVFFVLFLVHLKKAVKYLFTNKYNYISEVVKELQIKQQDSKEFLNSVKVLPLSFQGLPHNSVYVNMF